MDTKGLRVFEFFAGIGGMRQALFLSNLNVESVVAFVALVYPNHHSVGMKLPLLLCPFTVTILEQVKTLGLN